MRAVTRATVIAVLGLSAVVALAAVSLAQGDRPSDQVIAEGRVVFEANCVGCHQADGAGIPGVFPPLAGNDHVFDSAYVTSVIRNGLRGEIVVNGATFNSVMPAFASLTPDQITSVIAYLQYGLNGETTPTTVAGGGGSGAGTSSGGTLIRYLVAFVVLLGAAIALRPMAAARRTEGEAFATGQVWAKTLAIFIFFLVFTVMIPSQIIKWSALSPLPSLARDIIGTTVWFLALGGGMYLLRRAQKRRVI